MTHARCWAAAARLSHSLQQGRVRRACPSPPAGLFHEGRDAEQRVDEFRVAFVRETCGGVLRSVDHLQDACRQGGHCMCIMGGIRGKTGDLEGV
ncbi:hypothetical protein E2C01_093271 [Portunus trituberculatus]|uniref:Uncharacterized protein n=1 Tax=Portunus trituberculatus TaxID=210409 RepID=A0A5B7JUC7_PORTR|nr:hypothetical protein [Portunus trituberculatus]